RHNRRPAQSSLLTPRDAGPDEEKSLRLKIFCPANSIGKMGITSVDDDVSLLKMRNDLFDEFIHRLARLYHQHDLARRLKRTDKLGNGMCPDDPFLFRPALDKIVYFFQRSVVHGNGKAA